MEHTKIDFKYLAEKVPTLHQYMPSDKGKLLLENSNILVKNPSDFNDPYDCDSGLLKFDLASKTKVEKAIQKYNTRHNKKETIKYDDLTNEEIKTIYEQIFPIYSKTIGVSCFSEVYDSMLMWSHYARSHKGVCFGFDKMKLYNSLADNSPSNISLIKVHYRNNYEPEDFFMDFQSAIFNWISTKSECWNYEKEIRVFFSKINYAIKSESLIKFNIEAISEIYLGSKIDEIDTEFYFDFCKKKIPNAKIYKMTKPKNTFKLLPKLIN